MSEIKIACEVKDTVNFHLIKPLQGNYKSATEKHLDKLCRLIIKRGIRFPSFIARVENEIWAIDTHRRLEAYAILEKQGYAIPDIPVVYINAKNIHEAKQLLLECDSRYGKTSQQGYEEFAADIAFIGSEEKGEFYASLELVGIDVQCEMAPPENLDDDSDKDKLFYVKVNCENAGQVRRIVSLLEKNEVDKRSITISA
jgi:hypothetical protein